MLKAAWCALVLVLICGCGPSRLEREGQRLFAGCSQGVDDAATLKAGVFVCKGKRDAAPFAGNGRSCGSCHVPGDNFSITPARIATLPAADPFFFAGLDENQELLRTFGMVHVLAPGGIDDFRQTPKLVQLRKLCSKAGECDTLGLHGDRITDLGAFTLQAITNHLAKSTARVPGVDFAVPTAHELKALTAYQRSTLVSEQDERTAK